MTLAILLDVILAALLVATITYCRKLSKHLDIIRNSREELEALVADFTQSTEQAELSVVSLKKNTSAMVEKLQMKIEKAEYVANDLDFLSDKSERIADQMTAMISESRGTLPTTAMPASAGKASSSSTAKSAAYTPPVAEDLPTLKPQKAESKEKRKSADDTVTTNARVNAQAAMEKIAQKKMNRSDLRGDSHKHQEEAGRSKAEQELLDALKTMR